ncbi:hypothetical protein TNCV_1310161 [Trichonephila clavipes]|nr:hypothetical protein TNCV_1310161 [Trichonephila clavipes]
MGKDIQRGGNRIIKRSLEYTRTWRNIDLSEPRLTICPSMVIRISNAAATIREIPGIFEHIRQSLLRVHTCQWKLFQTPPVML